jgi:ribosomal protein S6
MAKKAAKPVKDEALEAELTVEEEADSTTGGEKRMYEAMLVLKPDMLESNFKKKLKDFKKYLEDHECRVTEEDVWEKRRLAYRIKQYEEAIYAVYNFESPSSFIQELENHLRIDNDVIRHLIITIPEGYKYIKFYEEVEEKKPEEKKKPAPKAEKPAQAEKPVEEKKEEEVIEKLVKEEKAEKPVEEKKEEEKKEEKPKPKKKATPSKAKAKEKAKEEKVEEPKKEEKKEEKEGFFSKLLGKKKKEEPKEEKKEEKISRSELDEKLDKLLGGGDLNI